MPWSSAWAGSGRGAGRAGDALAFGGDARAHLHQAVEAAPSRPTARPSRRRRAGRRRAPGSARAAVRRRSPAGRARRRAARRRARRPRRAARRTGPRRLADARSSAAQRLPAVVIGTSAPTSSKPGGSMRSTSAPCAARKRVHTGPAMTRVRSSTLIPASGWSSTEPPDGERPPARRHSATSRIVSTGQRRPRRMGTPLVSGAHHRRASAGGDHRGLQLVASHVRRRSMRAPCGRAPASSATPSAAERREAVVAVVGVQPDPAVGGGVVAGDRIPRRRTLPAVRCEERLAEERRRCLAGDRR